MLARETSPLKQTPLHALHLARGAKMVPFAGYDMPVQYTAGVLKEHLHTRKEAGLFEVSHMGQLVLRAKSGKVVDAALALEKLVPQDIVGIAPGRQRYAQFTNDDGGLRDDLMVANFGDHLFLVVNAACKAEDEAHLRAHLSEACEIVSLADRALIALQGPKAESALAKLCADVSSMKFMDGGPRRVADIDCFVSRSGYTGEDGFEISVPADKAEALVTALLDNPDVLPIGLGARDSLRLEAGLCLYGHDIVTTTTPVEGALEWSVQKVRRSGGARAGGFPGRGTLDLCAKSMVEKGAFTPALVVIMDGDYTSYDVPDGRSEMATFFVDKVEGYRGKAIGYLFITETWSLSLSTDDMDEIRKYANNPDMIVDNPFKEERLAFYGASKDESYSGYVPFGREENGEIKAENLVLDEDFLGDEYFVNIADLLLPMVQ